MSGGTLFFAKLQYCRTIVCKLLYSKIIQNLNNEHVIEFILAGPVQLLYDLFRKSGIPFNGVHYDKIH